MKGYCVLICVSLLFVLTVPFCAFGITQTPAAPPQNSVQDNTPSATQPKFKAKDLKTGNVLEMDEQTFLIAIVSCEMSPSAPSEALKAQAVAAYTYYVKQRAASADGIVSNVPETLFTYGTEEGMKNRWGDQYEKNYTAVQTAVQAVYGQMVLYDDQPITACYHAISAGLTENAADVWGGEYPYLVPVDSVGDRLADGYESTAVFSPDELRTHLRDVGITFTEDPAAWFTDAQTTDSGFVQQITLCGAAIKGTDLRTALALRSACFTVKYENGKFTFTVRGYGHNVGMSQAGAKYMASTGADYREILTHYYPNTTIR